MIKLSVITINFNNAHGLKRTVESILGQTHTNFEFIIIDGASSDASVTVIKQFENTISYWCSEKDNGIYDAQNKGIERATGEYLIFMNSGDTFFDNDVLKKFNEIQKVNDKDIIYGDVNTILEQTHELIVQDEKLEPYFWYTKTLNHQATFIKRKLFSEFGLYNTEYRISADFEFFLKIWLTKPDVYFYYPFTVCNFYLDGLSQKKENYDILIAERKIIYQKLLPPKLHKKLYNRYRRTLPLKSRLLDYIYEKPLLNFFFQKVFKLYTRLKS